jgi:hypothetical protein
MVTILFVFFTLVRPAIACTVSQYEPLSPEVAFQRARVVIHVRVISASMDRSGHTAKVKVLKNLKGSFSGDSVHSGACGFGPITLGREYVFFLDNESNDISLLRQPPQLYDTQQILTRLQTVQHK